MKEEQKFDVESISGPIVSACTDKQSREVHAFEVPCPFCGKLQEYFTDELRTKERLRCYDCKEYIDVEIIRKSAGL